MHIPSSSPTQHPSLTTHLLYPPTHPHLPFTHQTLSSFPPTQSSTYPLQPSTIIPSSPTQHPSLTTHLHHPPQPLFFSTHPHLAFTHPLSLLHLPIISLESPTHHPSLSIYPLTPLSYLTIVTYNTGSPHLVCVPVLSQASSPPPLHFSYPCSLTSKHHQHHNFPYPCSLTSKHHHHHYFSFPCSLTNTTTSLHLGYSLASPSRGSSSR
ncbi:hypothetical protein Pcinc_026491 [Petrolisthes cinctipes]|uniref:Uncharacterized protein n=1 Tax=Petrolisthes cinctipes TaxID=88211 RepID=A0AAE1K830_PETCI|nr:hypothetical protein Pcinc_026491 [Petrolisthes cinctipes]